MSRLSWEHVTVFQIGQTIFLSCLYSLQMVSKGVIALVSNAIESKLFKNSPNISFIYCMHFFTLYPCYPFGFQNYYSSISRDPHHTLTLNHFRTRKNKVLLYVWMFSFSMT